MKFLLHLRLEDADETIFLLIFKSFSAVIQILFQFPPSNRMVVSSAKLKSFPFNLDKLLMYIGNKIGPN